MPPQADPAAPETSPLGRPPCCATRPPRETRTALETRRLAPAETRPRPPPPPVPAAAPSPRAPRATPSSASPGEGAPQGEAAGGSRAVEPHWKLKRCAAAGLPVCSSARDMRSTALIRMLRSDRVAGLDAGSLSDRPSKAAGRTGGFAGDGW
eukprot:scaffold270_cov121-Isochrysis_galbana.AAC.8